jgi:hypothetical protein
MDREASQQPLKESQGCVQKNPCEPLTAEIVALLVLMDLAVPVMVIGLLWAC